VQPVNNPVSVNSARLIIILFFNYARCLSVVSVTSFNQFAITRPLSLRLLNDKLFYLTTKKVPEQFCPDTSTINRLNGASKDPLHPAESILYDNESCNRKTK